LRGDGSGGGRCEGGPFLESGIEDDDVHAAVAGAALWRVVLVHGMVLRETSSGKALRIDVVAGDKETDEFGGAGSGEFPVGGKARVVDGDVVGVSLDAEIFGARTDDIGEAIDGLHGRGAHGGGATVIKAHFAEADDEAFFSGFDLNDVAFDFRSEGFFEFRLDVFQGLRGVGGRENSFHGLDDAIEFRGAVHVIHGLDVGEGDGFGVAEGNVGVGGFKDAQFLKGDLNGEGQAPDAALVDLGGCVENDEESEEESDEVGVADHTVSNVINGVTLNLASPAPGTPVTLTVGPDTTQITAAINNLVSAYNTVIGEVNSQFTVASDGSGGGPLEADNTLRDVQSQLLGAIAYSVTGNGGIVNLASLGVNVNNDGTLSVDSGALNSALTSNYSAVQNFLQNTTTGFAQNLSQVLSNVNAAGVGLLSIDSQSVTNTSQGLTQQIADLQAALAVQQQNLTAVYSQVNVTLQQLPLLQSQISQQIAGLS